MKHVNNAVPGRLIVIAGCMFAGKTDTLIRHPDRLKWHKQTVAAFKPALDDRYHPHALVSHGDRKLDAISVAAAADIPEHPNIREAGVVGIDEAQFFGGDLPEVCLQLVRGGKTVIVAGLDLDYRGVPFGPMPTLLALADEVEKVDAACTLPGCGEIATRSQRIVDSQEQVVVGGASAYEARCLRHWSPEPVFTARERVAMGELDG